MKKIGVFFFRTLAGAAFLLAGIYLFFGSIWDYAAQHDRMDWTVQTAQVADISSRVVSRRAGSSRRSRTVYDITYQYEVDGEVYTGELNSTSQIRMVGDELKIKYDPEAPEKSTTILSPQLSTLLLPLGAGLVFATAGFFLSGLWAWIRKLRRRGQPEEEEVLPPEEYVSPEDQKVSAKGPAVAVIRVVVILIAVAMIVSGIFLFRGRPAATVDKFADAVQTQGYTAVDTTDKLRQEWKIGSLLEQAMSLEEQQIRIDFCVMDTPGSAKQLFYGMELLISEGEVYEDSGTNHEIYSIEGSQMYTVKLRVDTTVIYAACLPEYKSLVTDILEAIGYL